MKHLFEDVLNEYFVYLNIKLKKTTFEDNKGKILIHILPYFKGKDIYKINLEDVINWKNSILQKKLSYNYMSYLYYCLCNIFDYFILFYNIDKNYIRLLKNFKNNDIKNNGSFWSIEEFKKFLSVIDNEKDKLLFKLLYFTGIRKGELLALQWKDINFNENTLNINKTITRNHELLCPKTECSNRKIYLDKNIMKELIKFKADNNNIIFDISFTTLKRKKDYYCKKANVKQIKIHEFRHSHSIYLYLNKIPIEEIQHRLGHSNMSTTMDIYLKYLPKNEKRVIKLLNSLNY